MSTSEQHRLGTSLKIFVDFKKMNFSAYNMLFHSVIVSFMEFYQLIEVLSLSTNLSRALPRSPQHRTNQTLWLLAVVDDNAYNPSSMDRSTIKYPPDLRYQHACQTRASTKKVNEVLGKY